MGAKPRPFSTIMGIKVVTASIDKWNVVLVYRAVEKYFSLKYLKSTKGSRVLLCTTINKPDI